MGCSRICSFMHRCESLLHLLTISIPRFMSWVPTHIHWLTLTNLLYSELSWILTHKLLLTLANFLWVFSHMFPYMCVVWVLVPLLHFFLCQLQITLSVHGLSLHGLVLVPCSHALGTSLLSHWVYYLIFTPVSIVFPTSCLLNITLSYFAT